MVTECLFRLQNLTPPKSGVILRSGLLGIFVVQSVTTKGKKHLCSAAYANSGARAGSLSNAAVEKDRITTTRRSPPARPTLDPSITESRHQVLSNAEAREGCINPRSSLPPSILELFTLTHMSA